MPSAIIAIKTDKKLKSEAQKIAKDMGFPLGTLLNAYIRQFVKTKTVHFEAEPTPSLSKKTQEELAIIENDIKKGRNISPVFSDTKTALSYLKKAA